MKLKDYFESQKKIGRIDNEEFNKFLDTIPDLEVPKEVVNSLESSFITVDRATADDRVIKKLKSDILDPIDRTLSAFVDQNVAKIPADVVIKFREEKNTYKKVELISKATISSSDPSEDLKFKLNEKDSIITDLKNKISKGESEFQTKISEFEKDFIKKKKDVLIDSHLDKTINSFKFAESYDTVIADVLEAKKRKIKENNIFDVIQENGVDKIQVLEKGENGDAKLKYNGNVQVTLESLVSDEVKDFIKKSATPASGQAKSHPIPSTTVTNKGRGLSF